jgi:hypothetical protein
MWDTQTEGKVDKQSKVICDEKEKRRKESISSILKVPRQCPLVLLVGTIGINLY